MKTIITLDRANQPYGFPQLNGNGNFNSIIVDSGLTSTTISATTYLNLPSSSFTGGTVNGATNFTNGLTANTISATTYQNLPIDIRVTGGTYSGSTIIFTNNTGGTFSVTGITTSSAFTGGTVSGATNFTGGLTANTISATTYQNLPATPFLPLSGGTVTGDTIFTAGLTGSSIVSLNSLSYCWTGPIVGSIFSYFNDTIYSNETGKTHYFGGGPGNVQNNLSVPNGNVLISSGLTATTISATTYLNLPASSVKSINSVSGNTNAGSNQSTDYIYFASNTITITLPTAISNTNSYVIKNVGTGTITINTTSSQTIDGSLTALIKVQYLSLTLISDGANWNII